MVEHKELQSLQVRVAMVVWVGMWSRQIPSGSVFEPRMPVFRREPKIFDGFGGLGPPVIAYKIAHVLPGGNCATFPLRSIAAIVNLFLSTQLAAALQSRQLLGGTDTSKCHRWPPKPKMSPQS